MFHSWAKGSSLRATCKYCGIIRETKIIRQFPKQGRSYYYAGSRNLGSRAPPCYGARLETNPVVEKPRTVYDHLMDPDQ